MKINISDEFKKICPDFIGICLEADIINSEFQPQLWQEISEAEQQIRQTGKDCISTMESIQATRRAYKAFGKDPSRYRPAAESLIRRILKQQQLYRINTAVDLINLASFVTGYSIGGFDTAKISAPVCLGVGQAGEPYEGIGRGILNIEGLPVYRDCAGGFATPTSDHERTKIDLDTRHVTVFVNAYDGNETAAAACAGYIASLLSKYTETKNYEISRYA